jgi:hypothetical protein
VASVETTDRDRASAPETEELDDPFPAVPKLDHLLKAHHIGDEAEWLVATPGAVGGHPGVDIVGFESRPQSLLGLISPERFR